MLIPNLNLAARSARASVLRNAHVARSVSGFTLNRRVAHRRRFIFKNWLAVIFAMVRMLADELFQGAFGAASPRALFFQEDDLVPRADALQPHEARLCKPRVCGGRLLGSSPNAIIFWRFEAAGAKALAHFAPPAARLKPCPCYKAQFQQSFVRA